MAMVESAREVCCSVRVGGKNPKSVWWNDEIKTYNLKGIKGKFSCFFFSFIVALFLASWHGACCPCGDGNR